MPNQRITKALLVVLLVLSGGMLSQCQIAVDQPAPPPVAAPGTAPTSSSRHLALGNPSRAVANPNQPDNFLIERDQYALSYHRDQGIPNWVSWHLQTSDLGDVPRYSGPFITDTELPEGWYQVRHSDYTGSGYDRGHMTPSADRTATERDNQATFVLTNIVPQSPANNQGLWAQLESDTRTFLNDGNEVYIVSGGHGSVGTLADGRLTIPESVWKVMLILPAANGNDAARVTANTQLIAIWTPNDESVAGLRWQDYQTSLRCIEERTGLNLLSAVSPTVKEALAGESCDTATAPPSATEDRIGFTTCDVDPGDGVAPEQPIRVVSVDKFDETVTLQNVSRAAIDLDTWTLCSVRGGQQQSLSGRLGPGATAVFANEGNAIWSNNERDPAALYDADGFLVSYWPDS